MTSENPLSRFGYQPPHRLLVKARTRTGPNKGYFWEIVRDNTTDSVVRRSSESYGTMEEAYTRGAVMLNRLAPKT